MSGSNLSEEFGAVRIFLAIQRD